MLRGMACLISGFRHLLGDARSRAILWRMLMLLAGLMLVLGIGVYELSQYLAARFIPSGDSWYMEILAWLSWFFSLLLSLAVGVVCYVTLASSISAPWLDALAKQVDKESMPAPERPWWRLVTAGIFHSLMPLMQFIPYAALSVLLLLLPGIGSALASAAWSYAGIQLLAYEFLDTPASRRGWGWRERKIEIQQHRWFYLGLAGTASLLLLVPLLNLLVLPAAVVGLSKELAARRQTDKPAQPEGQPG